MNAILKSAAEPKAARKPAVKTDDLSFLLLYELLRDTAVSYSKHRVPQMSAALSYYTALSLAPMVILLMSLASVAVRREVAIHELVGQANNLLGPKGGTMVKGIVEHAASVHFASWGTGLSFLLLLVSSSSAFSELQSSLDQIWETPPQKHPVLSLIKSQGLSFAMVFILGLFMLLSLLLSAAVAAASHLLLIPFSAVAWEVSNAAISFIVLATLFAMIFRLLPQVPVTWRDVALGAALSAALFVLGKFVLGWYIGRNAFTSSYGAAGSLVVILIWVFYSAQILFIGAELSHAYAFRVGSHRDEEAREKNKPDGAVKDEQPYSPLPSS